VEARGVNHLTTIAAIDPRLTLFQFPLDGQRMPSFTASEKGNMAAAKNEVPRQRLKHPILIVLVGGLVGFFMPNLYLFGPGIFVELAKRIWWFATRGAGGAEQLAEPILDRLRIGLPGAILGLVIAAILVAILRIAVRR
jgi:hypothetical protein